LIFFSKKIICKNPNSLRQSCYTHENYMCFLPLVSKKYLAKKMSSLKKF
jgi:hypothetical protein